MEVDVELPEVRVRVGIDGAGPPVLLLHGFPETRAMWDRIRPGLASRHTVVAPDLRGYGESSIAPDMSFRAMAADQLALMRSLGHERFSVVGHDRGARVAHRLALDAPAAVERAAVLDILPTAHVYGSVDRRLATAYYHWFLFIQPAPLPERLLSGDPIGFLHSLLGAWGGRLDHVTPSALAAYERAFADPDRRHAMLEDYRAAATVDLEHDAASGPVTCPLLVLWGSRGTVGAGPDDPLSVWRTYATDVTGAPVDAGHFLAEERPTEVLDHLKEFLG